MNFLGDMYSREIPSSDKFSSTYIDDLVGNLMYEIEYSETELDVLGIPYEKNRLLGAIDYEKKSVRYIDSENTYIRNSKGYRSPEFKEGTELVFAGCSHSFGVGVPEETIWGSIVANTLGLSYANVSSSGKSAYWIVKNLFGYFRKYGNPKILLCYFPNFDRLVFPENLEIARAYGHRASKKEVEASKLTVANTWANYPKDRPRYSEKPHVAEDVIPVELSWMLNMQAIHSLIQYCKAADIKLLWGTWAFSESDLIRETSNVYGMDGFVDTNPERWHSLESDDYYESYHLDIEDSKKCYSDQVCGGHELCHIDLAYKYGRNFHIGTDSPYNLRAAHFGIHRHLHIALDFLKYLN